MSTQDARVDLVFEGGGVKGIGLAGAYLELDERGYKAQCVAGTSAGAITAALVAAGYTGPELEQVVLDDMHFPSFADRQRLGRFGAFGEAAEILRDRGMHSGAYFLNWITEKLTAKGVTEFGDLRDRQETDPARAYRLQVIASDLSDHSMLVLPRDAGRLGIEPDKLSVAEAVRMSMSIPIFFDPVIKQNPQTGTQHLIVDGGLLSNYPVWLFDAPPGTQPQFPTFGMMLVAPGQSDPLLPDADQTATDVPMPSLLGYVKALADTAMQAHDRFYIEDESFARTIPIPTLGVKTTQFNITRDQTLALVKSGRDAAVKFLQGWDFQAYIEKYRQGSRPTRTGTT